MHIAIVGAAGMIGRKLTARLVADGTLAGQAITRLTLVDVVEPPLWPAFSGKLDASALDISEPGQARGIVATRPDVVFHLAAIVSGEAELDFEKGYGINLEGTRALFEAIRLAHLEDSYRPCVVFTSSIAVFGAPLPDIIPDDFNLTPLTSYGTQKAMGELLLADYTRRGFIDGIGIRLPTICVRPGKPNKAASGFFSGIIREPLAGQKAVLPVPDSIRHWHASPRSAVGFLLHAASIDLQPLGSRRSLTMPGVSASVGEQIEALRSIAGEAAVNLIRREPDELVLRIVEGWPRAFAAERATSLGFKAETSFDEIIRVHIEDEMEGRIG